MSASTINEIFLWLGVAGYGIAALACLIGLYHANFEDNWPQTLGMFGIGVTGVMKVDQILDRGRVAPETALLGVSIALFAIGVAWKVYLHNRRYIPPPKTKAKRPRFRSIGH